MAKLLISAVTVFVLVIQGYDSKQVGLNNTVYPLGSSFERQNTSQEFNQSDNAPQMKIMPAFTIENISNATKNMSLENKEKISDTINSVMPPLINNDRKNSSKMPKDTVKHNLKGSNKSENANLYNIIRQNKTTEKQLETTNMAVSNNTSRLVDHSVVVNETNTSSISNVTQGNSMTPSNSSIVSVTDKCPPFYFPCNNKVTCVIANYVCDGYMDCPDGSDELEQICSTKEQELVMCNNGQVVQGNAMICNNVTDCQDGSDEIGCSSLNQQVCDDFTQFSCMDNNNACIDNNNRCDGINNCPNGLDEHPQMCGFKNVVRIKVSFSFQEFKIIDVPKSACDFQCSNGQCISQSALCDGFYDCDDGSDETDCDQYSFEQETNHGFDDKMTVIIILSVIASCILITIIALFCLFRKKSKQQKLKEKKAEINKAFSSVHYSTPPPSYEEVTSNKKIILMN